MDIDALLDDAFDSGQGVAWRDRISGDALAYIEAVENRVKETGDRPVFARISRNLKMLGSEVSASAVASHLRTLAESAGHRW